MTSPNIIAEVAEEITPFPPKAQAILNSFYDAKELTMGTTRDKLDALKSANGLKDAEVVADGGFSSEEEELRAFEFYVLTKAGVL